MPVPEPAEPGTLSGQTVTYGKCLWVNGEKMQAGFDLRDASETRLTVRLSGEEMAENLGAGLFRIWKLEGKATWRITDWKITALQLAVATQIEADSEALFKQLADESDGQWNDVDAIGFVDELRDGGER